MSESVVLDQIEAAASHYRICVLPRDPRRLECSVWSMPDPAFHVGVTWRVNTGALRSGRRFVRFGLSGLCDYTGWLFPDGRLFQIEAKSAKGKLSADQDIHRELCLKTGVLWGMVRNYQECVELLESWGLRRNV